MHGQPDEDFLIDNYCEHALEGFARGDEKCKHRVAVPYSLMEEFSIRLTHFTGLYQISHRNIYIFISYHYLYASYIACFYNKFRQSIFNTRTKIRGDRIDALNILIEHRYQSAEGGDVHLQREYALIPVEIVFKKYGHRIIYHPGFARINAEMGLILESLLASGDVDHNGRGYKVNGKSLETISVYEEDNRRFRSQRKQNRWLVFLTAVLAVSSVLEVSYKFPAIVPFIHAVWQRLIAF